MRAVDVNLTSLFLRWRLWFWSHRSFQLSHFITFCSFISSFLRWWLWHWYCRSLLTTTFHYLLLFNFFILSDDGCDFGPMGHCIFHRISNFGPIGCHFVYTFHASATHTTWKCFNLLALVIFGPEYNNKIYLSIYLSIQHWSHW